MIQPLWPERPYKSHQKTAIEWMIRREECLPSGGLLCDDMGLGKTTEVLGLIKNSPLPPSKTRHTLLLCPKAVISQWAADAIRSNFNVMELVGSIWKKPHEFQINKPFLYITNFEKINTRPSAFDRQWGRVCIDEAHRVTNVKGRMYSSLKKIKRHITWCITATPVVNKLDDVIALFGLVGYNRTTLRDTHTQLYPLIQEALLHRSMEEMRPILKELPKAAVIVKELLPFKSQEEEDFYRGIQGRLVARWNALDGDNLGSVQRFEIIMKLRQLAIHPQIYITARKKASASYIRDDWSGTSAKFERLLEIMGETKEPTKFIIFCQFRNEMDLLEECLYDSEHVGRVQQYHGGLSMDTKTNIIELSKNTIAKHDILLLQLQSGGVGLNLQHFTKIVFMSPWWTKALMNQAIGRAVRIGQTQVVEVIKLLLREEETLNIDSMMLESAERKGEILEDILSRASKGNLPTNKLSPTLEDGVA